VKEDLTTTSTTALWWCRQCLYGGLMAESMAVKLCGDSVVLRGDDFSDLFH
jgi:hypothetical protein